MEKSNLISAMVVVKSEANKEEWTNEIIDTQNVSEYLPDISLANRIQVFFLNKGFNIGHFAGNSFSIEADQKLFEDIFDVELMRDEQKGVQIKSSGNYELPKENLPETLQKDILNITFSEPVELFF